MKVVGYARVSTQDQATEGVSLGNQRDKIEGYASLHELDLVAIVEDPGASAKSLRRPGLARVLAMLDAGEADGVVILKLDRLTRSLGDWVGLIDRYFGEKGGKRLLSIGDSVDTRSATGRMMLNIIVTVATWEREILSERTRDALRHKIARGERAGGRAPYGWRLDAGRIVPDPLEQAARMLIVAWHREGRTLKSIARELDARGIVPRSGKPWALTSIRHIARSTPSEVFADDAA